MHDIKLNADSPSLFLTDQELAMVINNTQIIFII